MVRRGGSRSLKKSSPRRPWLIPGLVALILFVGNLASNLVANDLQTSIAPYRRWIWIVFVIALVVTVIIAIVGNSRKDSSEGDERTERSVPTGDSVAGDKNVYINQSASQNISALHQLRAPVGDFVGREREIQTLINALRRNSRPCITGVSGMGGIGKTELALLVAGRLADDYPDAQFFINLQGTETNPRSPAEVMATCIRAFCGPEVKLPDDVDQLLQRYRSELTSKRALLLFDNAADSAQLLPLLPPSSSALLVTSRHAISLPGMTPVTLNPLTEEEAQRLLLEIAPHAHSAAAQICSLCGYLPLAIRAAGSLLAITADLDPFDYATQLKDERKRLERIGTEGVEIDVAASFNLSYARLTPEAARVFRFLSVFAGAFDATAGGVVCGDADHVQLSGLVRRSLVLYDSTTKRYRLHDLIRLFASSNLSSMEREMAYKLHAAHYRDVLAAADSLYLEGGEALARGLALFDLERSNIDAGHAWVAAQDDADEDIAELARSYPDAGVYVLSLRQHPREKIRWLEIALSAARRLKHRHGEALTVGNLGLAYADLGETERAIEFYEQQLEIARELGDRQSEGADLANLGLAYSTRGEIERALQFFDQALIIFREFGDRRAEGTTLGNLGNAYGRQGDIQRAILFYEQQLTVVREIGDRRGEGMALGNLGIAYAKLGQIQRSLEFYEPALRIDRELGDLKGEATDLLNMSLALYQLGQRAQAIEYVQQSLAIFEQIESPFTAKVREQLAEWRART